MAMRMLRFMIMKGWTTVLPIHSVPAATKQALNWLMIVPPRVLENMWVEAKLRGPCAPTPRRVPKPNGFS